MEKLKAEPHNYCCAGLPNIAENAIAKTKGLNDMKKTLPILFSLALVCCSFTACGNSEKNNNSQNATDSPATEQESTNPATEKASETTVTDNRNDESATDKGGIVGNIVTDAEGIVDDLVSTGEDIVDDAGSVVEGVGDAITGTDNQ